ncbi:hypothetical protein A2947_03275 [Candidatus Peribacteria bacterium RIFCSPLOWO2_01_FULL_54_110]|nr:MAG: hypothetical protein A2947_03275 [Candidatus Peribacteria bacterium RIFCSPLOWO2_01_FULL_54_110]
MLRDSDVRRAVTRESHLWFFVFYFAHYMKYPMAAFHREIFAITENPDILRAIIVAFRGSGKSTLITLSYVLWAIMGREQRKFVTIVGRTQEQARQMLRNLRTELESNELLRHDLGPFRQEEDEWRNTSLVITNYGARITAVSVDQSVRGLRHNQHRPDVIVCDDIEDLDSVQTRESRNKTRNWVVGELLPAGDRGTRFFLVGNYLHDDSLTQRMKEQIETQNDQCSVYRAYPLLDDENRCLWREKYPDDEAIQEERARVGDESAWYREYLLRILSDTERVIHPEWIQYYDAFPAEDHDAKTGTRVRLVNTSVGIDLAISQNDSADFTAMVGARIYYVHSEYHIYILPNPVNERITPMETLERAKQLADCTKNGSSETKLYIEDVGYQASLAEFLKDKGYEAEGVKLKGQDKRSRLALASHPVQAGKVFFPREGAEELIDQLVNFGIEKHDDLADAFSLLILKSLETKLESFGIGWIGGDGFHGWDRIRGEF